MTVEEKVITSVRKILLSDVTISGVFGTNVYASHISSITKPLYPAISLHLLPSSGADDAAVEYSDINMQIDGWFPSQQYDMSAVLSLIDRLRNLLHRQFITDKTIPVAGSGLEKAFGQVVIEDDTKLMHLPVIYSFKAF